MKIVRRCSRNCRRMRRCHGDVLITGKYITFGKWKCYDVCTWWEKWREWCVHHTATGIAVDFFLPSLKWFLVITWLMALCSFVTVSFFFLKMVLWMQSVGSRPVQQASYDSLRGKNWYSFAVDSCSDDKLKTEVHDVTYLYLHSLKNNKYSFRVLPWSRVLTAYFFFYRWCKSIYREDLTRRPVPR